jgi:hypothetical protein
VIERIARRSGERSQTEVPGSSSSRSTDSRFPILQRAMRDGNARRWPRGSRRQPSLRRVGARPLLADRAQPGRDPARRRTRTSPAFRWVEKSDRKDDDLLGARGLARSSSAAMRPASDAHGRRREPRNLPLGRGEHVILTGQPHGRRRRARTRATARSSRTASTSPGCSSCSSGGVPRSGLPAFRAIRRDVRPRGTAAGSIPFMRAAMCVVVRDLIVYGVLLGHAQGPPCDLRDVLELRRGGAPLGARTRRHLEALRKLDQQFGRIDRAARTRPRPYEIVVSPTTDRPRARRSSSATATASTSSSSARSPRARSRSSRVATSRTRWSDSRWARRRERIVEEEAEERRLGPATSS